ncbi:hypothetical protein HPP92_014168 [Vanilla planifolia]|uniref:Uncharacterized protein n=1 Tax=Vanilla planifolia TaxID=51239 RepID=A0A835QTB6_VANPL|nr:hypothetical protein HPP92_014168 [Vanilla planifolia]
MLLLVLLVSALVEAAGKAPVLPVGSTSQVEDAELFRLYYGQSFKVIKNSVDGNSYLLMQNDSRMAARTKYCTGRIKSFVIPLVNYSVDTTFFPAIGFTGRLEGNDIRVCHLRIKENYNCLTKAAANLTTRFKPIVAWVEYKQGLWGFSREDYKLQFVTDAGGENVDGTISSNSYNVSSPDDMENFYAILCTVDVVIDQTYASEPAEYMLSTFLENLNVDDNATFDFVKNQSLWRYDKRVQNSSAIDWYDGAISQPQLVLADLIEMFFSIGSYTLTFFRNIAKNEGVSFVGPESCNRSTSAPLDPIIVSCS